MAAPPAPPASSALQPRPRLMLVDDHHAVREGYRRLLESMAGVEVGWQAGSSRDAYAQLLLAERARQLPQAVVIDLNLGNSSGMMLIERCHRRFPALPMLVFSMHEQWSMVEQALALGARGFVSKASAPELLVEAVAAVLAGQRFVDPSISQRQASDRADERLLGQLTHRELEILRQMMRGATLEEVAQRLSLSAKTVANQLSAVRQKAGVSTDFQLVQRLARSGLSGY